MKSPKFDHYILQTLYSIFDIMKGFYGFLMRQVTFD